MINPNQNPTKHLYFEVFMQDMVKTIVLNSAKTKIRMIDSLEKSEK